MAERRGALSTPSSRGLLRTLDTGLWTLGTAWVLVLLPLLLLQLLLLQLFLLARGLLLLLLLILILLLRRQRRRHALRRLLQGAPRTGVVPNWG